jgi:hypothetical protein
MAWIAEEQFQQAELGVGEVDALAATRHLASVGINHQLTEAKHTLAGGKLATFNHSIATTDATKNRCDTGFEFFRAEGLWKVIVSAQVEPSYAFRDGLNG